VRCLRTDCPLGRANLREAMAQWRIGSTDPNGPTRAQLDRQIIQAELRLSVWERAHRDD
jgi:hypothetical protein